LLLTFSRLESVRPLDSAKDGASVKAGRDGKEQVEQQLQQNKSLVEVGTQHFVHTSKSQIKMASQGSEVLAEVGSKAVNKSGARWAPERRGDQPDAIYQDEWEDEDDEVRPTKQSSRSPSKRKGSLNYKKNDELKQPDDQVEGFSEVDELQQPDDQGEGFSAHEVKEPEDHAQGVSEVHSNDLANPAPYVEKGPELSHREDSERANHFQEFLNHRPRLEDAANHYKKDIATVKQSARDVDKHVDYSLRKFDQFNGEAKAVQDEVGHLKRAVFADTREAAVNSVDSFASYNKNGVYGSSGDAKWVPDAGQWNIFKELLFPNGKRLGGTDSS